VFTEDVYHGSFGGEPGRHQHAVNFGAHPRTEGQYRFLRETYEKFNYALHPAKSFIDSERPRIRRMVSLLVELGFEPFDA
jgi:hypothetical protein